MPSTKVELAETPFFWLFLFSLAALVGLMVIGPKHVRRQQRLDLQKQGRQTAWANRNNLARPQAVAGVTDVEDAGADASSAGGNADLTYLVAAIGAMTVLLGIGLAVTRWRQTDPVRGQQTGPVPRQQTGPAPRQGPAT